MEPSMPFTGNRLDRAGNQRHDEAWMAEQLESQRSRFMALSGLRVLVLSAERPVVLWLDRRAFEGIELREPPIFLGLENDAAHFAVDLTEVEQPLQRMGLAEVEFMDARALGTALHAHEAGIVAQARSLLDWHARHQFCATCGARTQPKSGGRMRVCDSCEKQHFPRTDPVVIMVVWRGDRCLLARRAGRPNGNFSAVAGFVDQGETIEDAVRREVWEEVGIRVDEVTYYASQPWPFPSQLMIGCFAHATHDDFKTDDEEITEARWFTRDEVRQAITDGSTELVLPGPVAIAWHLVSAWCNSAPGTPGRPA